MSIRAGTSDMCPACAQTKSQIGTIDTKKSAMLTYRLGTYSNDVYIGINGLSCHLKPIASVKLYILHISYLFRGAEKWT